MIEAAFWDASALIPLCTDLQASAVVDKLYQQYSMTIWWGTPVEIRSAFARLIRTGELAAAKLPACLDLLDDLVHRWHEIAPSASIRDFAEELPARFGLRAADALQIAAACTWTMQRPANRPFLSGDQRLLDAARQLGFRAIAI